MTPRSSAEPCRSAGAPIGGAAVAQELRSPERNRLRGTDWFSVRNFPQNKARAKGRQGEMLRESGGERMAVLLPKLAERDANCRASNARSNERDDTTKVLAADGGFSRRRGCEQGHDRRCPSWPPRIRRKKPTASGRTSAIAVSGTGAGVVVASALHFLHERLQLERLFVPEANDPATEDRSLR